MSLKKKTLLTDVVPAAARLASAVRRTTLPKAAAPTTVAKPATAPVAVAVPAAPAVDATAAKVAVPTAAPTAAKEVVATPPAAPVVTPVPAKVTDAIARLRDASAEVAVEAAQELGALKNAHAVDALVSILANNDGYAHVVTRAAAAGALGQLASPRSIEALFVAATDASAEVSAEAILALGYAKATASVSLLETIAANETGYYLPVTRHAAIRSLGTLAAASSKAVLARIAASETESLATVSAARDAIAKL